MVQGKRKIEVFTAGCEICNEAVEKVKAIACECCQCSECECCTCSKCECAKCACCECCECCECACCKVLVYNVLTDKEALAKAQAYGVKALPSVAVNGQLLGCCRDKGVSEKELRNAGVGKPL